MAWSNSRAFREFFVTALGTRNTGDSGLVGANTINAALFNDTITPDKDATAANARYGAGVWASGGVSDVTNWPAVGRPLASKTLTTPSSGVTRFDAADTAGGGTLTLTNAYGCLIYNDSVTAGAVDQGVCYNYFGGAQSVSGGTFTIVWSANGIFEVTA
jgi:hypothetical protein